MLGKTQQTNKDIKNLLCFFHHAAGKWVRAHAGPACRDLAGREDKGDTLATNPTRGCTAGRGVQPGRPWRRAQDPRVHVEGAVGSLGFRAAIGRVPHMLGVDGDWKAACCGPTRLDPRGAHWGRKDPWLCNSG